MTPFTYQRAASVEDAIDRVGATGGKYLAGGTNLVDLMKDNVEAPAALIDIRKLDLKQIRITRAAAS
jgi:xanthine dehydrogenase YagS FAD-binding subunit